MPKLPAAIAFVLLLFQAVIPWTSRYFITQDGPSHLYTALVARDLVLHPSSSPYARVYRLQSNLGTNWGTLLLLNLIEPVAGAAHVDQALSTLCVIGGFFAFSYLRRAIDPTGNPYSPITNFLLNTWFLWIGFFNFYLGMVLCLFIVGYTLRAGKWWVISALLVLLFFTHVLALAFCLMALALLALWNRTVPRTLAAAAPALLLLLLFLRAAPASGTYTPGLAHAWEEFPRHVFAASRGRTGEEELLRFAMLFYMAIGIASLKPAEWRGPRGAMATAAILSLAGYLLVPDAGFGGGEIKIRFAWAIFLFGLAAAQTRQWQIPVSLYVACFLTPSLVQAMRLNVQNVGRALEVYSATMDGIPSGATFVRIRKSTEVTRTRYGFETIALEPFFHADAWIAARKRCIDLSDYQAATKVFPVAFKALVTSEQQGQLLDLEGTGPNAEPSLEKLLATPPVHIDYVAHLGEPFIALERR